MHTENAKSTLFHTWQYNKQIAEISPNSLTLFQGAGYVSKLHSVSF